ncbi:ATP-grasp domain-containing protein [Plantactinospora sp. WMMB782]|uniref:preATP grasp domain-containing protein n=1 Tax=Plantactinospora sp. WMMB782 TaxID=3404121 RepID=UPI003B960689
MDTSYLRTLKANLLGAPDGRLVLVCNFEAENWWAEGHVGLPAPRFSAPTSVVARMEEHGILLAGADDVLLLKHPLDPGYRDYLSRLGMPLPTVLVPENVRADRSTTEDVLDSPELLRRLAALGAAGARLLPMGTTVLEQKLADRCGLPLAVPDATTFARVNSKIYSRRLTEAAGLRAVPGDCCETRDDLAAVLGRRRAALTDGVRLVVKDAYGVSGKGLLLLDRPETADRLLRMVDRRAERTGDDRLHVVVEEWVEKSHDLNYQLTVSADGRATLDFVKRAITENGVHKGHLMPVALTPAQQAELTRAVEAVGARLHTDGYAGVVGVDAVVATGGELYPVLEINARLNMSSYQGGVTELCQRPGQVALARHYPLRLAAPVSFAEVARTLAPVLDRDDGQRFVVTCFGTVNADADRPPPFDGRLYALLVAADPERLSALDDAAGALLAGLAPGQPG